MIKYILSVVLLLTFEAVPACTCVPLYNEKGEQLERKYDVIMKATVVRIDTIYVIPESFVQNGYKDSAGIYGYTYNVKVTVVVQKVYTKGKKKFDRFTLVTGVRGGDCGYNFKVNKQYLIFGNYNDFFLFSKSTPGPDVKKKTYLTTDDCSYTTDNIQQGEDRLRVGKRRNKL